MALQYSPKIVSDSLVMCLDASQNKSYPTTDLPVKDRLNLWLDAADDTTFSYSSGTTVSQWRDKSGQNNHAAAVGGSPSRSVAINSRKTVSFTSTTSFKCVTGTFSSTATHIVVCRATTSSATYQRVYNGGANTDYYVFIGGYANNISTFWGSSPSVWFDTNANSPSTTLLNTLRIISAVNNGTTATPYYDGTSMSTKTTTNSAAYTGYELNTYSGGATNQPLVGDVCEIIVFNKQLSTTELKQVHTYLGQKWDISNTDRSIIDLSGNDDSGLLGGGAAANMPVYDFYNKGSLRFDGLNDTVNINNSQLNISTSITVEAWVKYNAQGGATARAYSVITYKSGWGWLLEDQGGQFNFRISTSVNGDSNVNSSYSHGLNNWNHVVGTYDGLSQKIYVDGILKNSTSLTGTINVAGNTVRLGNYEGDYNLTGNIGVVRVYNRALSAAEIAQNYEAQKSKFANTIVQQGLVLNLDIGNPYSYGGGGTTVYDVSPTALSWTMNNITYNSDPIKYFSYNGSSSWLESSTSAAYDSQTITMECWFYPTSTAQYGFLFEKGQVNTQYSMFLNGDGTFYFRTISISTQDLTFTSSSFFNANAWNHLVCTYGSGTKTVYVNGVQVSQQTGLTGTIPTGQTNQYIGKYGNAANNYPFNGRIAETRVYNIALTAAQVLQNYNATRTKYGL